MAMEHDTPALNNTMRTVGVIAGLLGLLGVAAGAFGAHGLRERVDERLLAIWETASNYQLVHAVALLVIAVASSRIRHRALPVAAFAFIGGVCIFSGTLYLRVLTGERWLGAITPIGGVGLLIGWAALCIAFYPRTQQRRAKTERGNGEL